MRPWGSIAVASSMTTPAPDIASVMAFCRCHSVGSPSTAEYWHIGEIAMRFGATSGPISTGLNSNAMDVSFEIPEPFHIRLGADSSSRVERMTADHFRQIDGAVGTRNRHVISRQGGELAVQSLQRLVDPGTIARPGLDRRGLLHLGTLLGRRCQIDRFHFRERHAQHAVVV